MRKPILVILAMLFAGTLAAQNVGINTTTPVQALDVNGSQHISGRLGIGITVPNVPLTVKGMDINNGYTYWESFRKPDGVTQTWYTGTYTASPNNFMFFNSLTASTPTFTLATGNKVGINNPNPHAELQLSTTGANRKFVLFDNLNNDHQFYGFGINAGMLRYQVAGTTENHVFYAGTSTTTSDELMRITGTGNLGIGTAAPAAKLHLAGEANPTILLGSTSNAAGEGGKISFRESPGTSLGGFGMDLRHATQPTAGVEAEGLHYEWNNLGTITQIMTVDQNNQRLGIGTKLPTQKLHVVGNAAVTGNLGIGTTNPTEKLELAADGKMLFASGTNAAPIVGARSPGAKIVLFSNFAPGVGDYAIGMENSAMWQSVPTTGQTFKWYGGSTEMMNLTNSNLNLVGATATGTAFAWTATSDRRLKKDIAGLENVLPNVLKMRGVSYNWKANGNHDLGVIAQEVEAIYPEFVHTDDKGMKSVAYGKMSAVLIEAVKELNAKINKLEGEKSALKASNETLESRLAAIEAALNISTDTAGEKTDK